MRRLDRKRDPDAGAARFGVGEVELAALLGHEVTRDEGPQAAAARLLGAGHLHAYERLQHRLQLALWNSGAIAVGQQTVEDGAAASAMMTVRWSCAGSSPDLNSGHNGEAHLQARELPHHCQFLDLRRASLQAVGLLGILAGEVHHLACPVGRGLENDLGDGLRE